MDTSSGMTWAWIALSMLASSACGSAQENDGSSGLCAFECASGDGPRGSGTGGSQGGTGAAIAAGTSGTNEAGSAGMTAQGGIGGSGGVLTTSGGAGGVAGVSAGEGGAGDGGMIAGAGGGGDSGQPQGDGCTPAPMGAVSDYGARGPFAVLQELGTGPSGQYTMFRPSTLGEAGFKHPPASWGNGITTTPALYVELLETVASHGFVVIASDSSTVTSGLVREGLEWLIQQNDTGELAGKLAVDCAATIGYSLGGGAAIGAGAHPSVKAIVSLHGLQDAAENASGPVLLITSDNDGFVTKSGFVAPTYTRSSVQPTIMATLETGLPADFAGHLIPLGDAGEDRAPLVAWLRYWLYGDTGASSWFFGSDCTLCKSPWLDIQRKNHAWD